MSKTVISLVLGLGVKSSKEVIALLRDAGVNVEAEGFGVMSRIDDDIVAKLRSSSPTAAPGAKKPAAASPKATAVTAEATPARAAEAETEAPARSAPRKDFF